MAQLTGNPIKDSYLGLLKTTDNAAVGATEKQMTDGAGNNVPMTIGTAGVSFTGGADFTAATVTGISAGGAAFSTSKVSETQATSSCDTIRASVLIPANTFGAGDILEVRSLQSISDSTGWVYPELWISTVGTVGSGPSGVNVAQAHTSSNGKTYYQKTIFVNADSGTGNIEHWPLEANESYSASTVTGGDPITVQTVDWTVDQYLAVKVCIDNSGATWTNYGAVIRKIN
jgi:hypothetical protein